MSSAIARGIRMNYSIIGSGSPAIVTMHGLILDNMSSFYFTIGPTLAKKSRLLLYDMRGHGRTEQPPTGYAIDDLAKDAEALLETIEFSDEPVVLLGHSFGGLVALHFAKLFPERVRGLILLDSQPATPDFGPKVAASLTAPPEEQKQLVRELFEDWANRQREKGGYSDIDATIRQMERLSERQKTRPNALVEQLVQHSTLVEDLAATPALSDEELAQISCPVLGIYGDLSEMKSEGERLKRVMPNCQLVILPDCAHGVLWQERSQILGPISSWLEGLP